MPTRFTPKHTTCSYVFSPLYNASYRAANKATLITSQLPVDHWHAWIGDAILDRIMQRNHRFTLTGDSLRAEQSKTTKKEENTTPS